MTTLNTLVQMLSDKIWFVLMILLVGSGLFFSVRTRFIQVRRFRKAWKHVFGNLTLFGDKAEKGGISSFQALATAIAAQVGTGNIAGCASALVSGGPGAIFWMWLAAFFGMATIYSEAVMAQATRTKDEDGHVIGGPVYYIQQAFHGKFGRFLAAFFSVSIILALGLMGNMVQSNSISDAFFSAFGWNRLAVGIAIAVVAGFIFIGGISRIAHVTEKIVPVMAALYLVGGFVCLFINRANLLPAITSIFVGAFQPQAVLGAGIGITVRQAMRYGVARGLFSNEAGMGSTPHAHALAKVDKPQQQGEVAMIGVFFDTFIVLTMTALIVLSSGKLGEMIRAGMTGTPVVQQAVGMAFGKNWGAAFIAIALLFFAFSTIISWFFFAKQNMLYLFGKHAVKPFAIVVVLMIILGATLKVELVWNLADLFNAIMVFPNLLALLVLSGRVAKISNESQ